MIAPAAFPRWTVEQFLIDELASTVRHEFVEGLVYPMVPSTVGHSALSATVVALLYHSVRSRQCHVFTCNLKLRVTPTVFLYPDASVACGRAGLDDVTWLDAAHLVIEVLSESTAAYDRGDKFALYQQHAALQDYVLIETRWQQVEVRSRQDDGAWLTRRYEAGDLVRLPSLDLSLPMTNVYEDVDVPTTEPAD
jgi:Uma2 family endonuclease